MAKGQNNYFLNNLLNLLTNPVHRRRQQNRVAGQNGHRIIGETIDETGKARDVVSDKQSEMEIDYNSGITTNQAVA